MSDKTDDIVERLQRKGFHGPTMEASHTKTLEWEAADTIASLRAKLDTAREALKWYAEQAENCRKLYKAGEPARAALDRDGGQRANTALKELDT